MRIAATQHGQSAIWQHTAEDLLALAVWTERVADHGEDAEPLLAHHEPSGRGLLAVFDGVGGSGAAGVGSSGGGPERTAAWVGSRVARASTEEWFLASVEHGTLADSDGLHRTLVRNFGEIRRPGRRAILGSMRREFPTTIAGFTYEMGRGRVRWQTLWAGDSRCFVLDTRTGLQQLSRDDTDEVDALVLLTEDPPMTNLVSADRDFRIHCEYGESPAPTVLLCATDGFFGYVHTPADFEHVLLDALMRANDMAHWAALLAISVAAYTGDDASLALIVTGHQGFDRLRQGFADRARFVVHEHWLPMQRAVTGDREQLVMARTDSWLRYRPSYQYRVPPTVGWEPR